MGHEPNVQSRPANQPTLRGRAPGQIVRHVGNIIQESKPEILNELKQRQKDVVKVLMKLL